ncbi:MAG TPA: metal-dependent hydrolase [Burkholderiaceae bacterium]|nr:metal-dependent hydrolase [Burkholderiaceae bacterium]
MYEEGRAYPVRKLSLDLKAPARRLWFGGDAFRTHWFNSLSQGLPLAERYASDCVKAAMEHVSDPDLLERSRDFVGQEATHSFLHRQCNEQLEAMGLRYWLDGYTAWRMSKAHWLSWRSGLALTVAWEHFTTILCEHTLAHSRIESEADEPYRSLWMWHCAEELEHSALSHELYLACRGSYLRLLLIYLYGSMLFVTDFLTQAFFNIYQDGQLFKWATWRDTARYFLGRKGLFWYALPRWLGFLRPGFRAPRGQHAALIDAALGALKERLRIIPKAHVQHSPA